MEETLLIDNYISWFYNCYDEPGSLLDMFHLYPVPHPHYPEETEKQLEYDSQYWLSESDSFCGGSYWGDYLFSGSGYCRDDDICNDPMVNREDCSQREEQYQSSSRYNHEDEFSQPDYDFNPWSYHLYCEEVEEDSYCNYGEGPRTTNGHCTDEVGLCDGIFGYFPCLLRELNEIQQYAVMN
ncbi:hypothetical protein Gorai_021832 [Gossypium raimondii]|uniref:Uncharacterized protein n=1 Tax=Gossypium raimondii TaxID=29730 RepID=A0A7J8NRG6_GOSRA|nr:hypothetical protein [Gossypium raimondii]